MPGMVLDASAMYAQALFAESTPSSKSVDQTTDSPLASKGKRPSPSR